MPEDAEAAQRLERERRRPLGAGGHQHPGPAARGIAETEPPELALDPLRLEPRAGDARERELDPCCPDRLAELAP